MNYATAKLIGAKLNEMKGNKKLVFLSASSNIPFVKRYRENKWKAEEFLFNLPAVKTTVLRPGFVYSKEQTLKYGFSYLVSAYAYLYAFVNGMTPFESKFKQYLKHVMVDQPIDGRAVAISAVVAAFDEKLDGKILSNEDMEELRDLFVEKGYEFPTE